MKCEDDDQEGCKMYPDKTKRQIQLEREREREKQLVKESFGQPQELISQPQ
jgi:hypothetical protein